MDVQYLLLYILVLSSVVCDSCVVVDFEEAFNTTFSNEFGVCLNRLRWNLGYYDNLPIESPDPQSLNYVYPNVQLSCVSSFSFPMAATGVVEVNIFMEPTDPTDQLTILVHQIVPGDQDAVMGNRWIIAMDDDFFSGWRTERIYLTGFGAYEGYVTLMGIAQSDSIILIDSFRYIPPGTRDEDCVIYEEDITSTITTRADIISTISTDTTESTTVTTTDLSTTESATETVTTTSVTEALTTTETVTTTTVTEAPTTTESVTTTTVSEAPTSTETITTIMVTEVPTTTETITTTAVTEAPTTTETVPTTTTTEATTTTETVTTTTTATEAPTTTETVTSTMVTEAPSTVETVTTSTAPEAPITTETVTTSTAPEAPITTETDTTITATEASETTPMTTESESTNMTHTTPLPSEVSTTETLTTLAPPTDSFDEATSTYSETTTDATTLDTEGIDTTGTGFEIPTTGSPPINSVISGFWNPYTITMVILLIILLILIIARVSYLIGMRKRRSSQSSIISSDFGELPRPIMIPRVEKVNSEFKIPSL